MIASRYWQWHIKTDSGWTETCEHERADVVKPKHPEALPVLGSMIWHCVEAPDALDKLYDSLGPDVPF